MFQNETIPSPVPLRCALFLLPFLGIFELGRIAYSPECSVPFLHEILVPGMFSCILLAVLFVQHLCYREKQSRSDENVFSQTAHPRWSFGRQWKESCWFGLFPALLVLVFMFIAGLLTPESTGEFRLDNQTLQSFPELSAFETSSADNGHWGHIAFTAVQAGLLEEFFFRVLLLSGLFGLLLGLKVSRRTSLVFSVVLSSGLFALAHEASLPGDLLSTLTPDSPGLFLYRFGAGTYLAMITMYRGFGIAAGAHIFYNLLIGCCL